ncbi:unnamed protein product [Polarella glacialis]|uniref:Uncharacterized protein n=1 Tax=Polarella glacialis TaxID=89957 RepID=A0A813GRI1_POLGL|nr:unnamed protein product [Polarella glacialis]
MADGDGREKEYVEGFAQAGQPLERISKPATLQELQREIKKNEVDLNAQLQKEQDTMADLQNKLKECNENYSEEKRKLDELRSEQRVTLDGDQKQRIIAVTGDTVAAFVAKRPRRQDEQMTVDVHFLTGIETTGFNLHINGEGAGSRDAKFLVQLDQQVVSLATQAAKYWGLDPDKVFFLDRDGRIVPENMNLVDIILPPLPPSAPAPAADAPSNASDEGDAAAEKDLFMVRGRNYCLTLVRASTVLSREDLNRPKGEKWEDFTFNEASLNRELENTRKMRGDGDGEAGKINMDAIPSLNDLMQQGQEKKRRKRADTRCRVLEFCIFVLCEILFILALVPNDSHQLGIIQVSQRVVRGIGNFTDADNSSSFYHPEPSFADIATPDQYWEWLDGPLKRVLLGNFLNESNLFVLAVVATRYTAPPPVQPSYIEFCVGAIDAAAIGNGTNGTNVTNTTTFTVTATSTTRTITQTMTTSTGTSTASTTSSTATTVTSTTTITNTSTTSSTTSASTTSTSTVTFTTTTTYLGNTTTSTITTSRTSTLSTTTEPPNTTTTRTTTRTVTLTNASNITPVVETCIPRELESCPNLRVMQVLADAMRRDLQVPSCKPKYSITDDVAVTGGSAADKPFQLSRGKVSIYFDGEQAKLDYKNGSQALNQSLYDFTGRTGENFTFLGSAHKISVVVYSPSLNAAVIFHWLVEQSRSGRLLSTITLDVENFSEEEAHKVAFLATSAVLGGVVFLMEVRRMLGCPKALTFEDERDKCSCWVCLFLTLPLLVLAVLSLFASQGATSAAVLDSETDTAAFQALHAKKGSQGFLFSFILVTLFVFNVLMFKFLLMHFPQLDYTKVMVQRMIRPMLVTILFLLFALLAGGVCLFGMYGDTVDRFRNPVYATVAILQLAVGSLRDWYSLYAVRPTLFSVVVSVTFVLLRVIIQYMPIAIMLSHKKEMSLFENYSYHPFWASLRSHGNTDANNFNPATIGFDFTGKEPRLVPDPPALREVGRGVEEIQLPTIHSLSPTR